MAQSSKEKLIKNAHVFKEKLEALGCPYTEGVEESWVLDLIFKPGEHRIRLLQWLFSKFDSHLHDLLDPQYVSSDMKMDSRIQRLLFVASSLGLCRPEDAELIRGSGSLTKQMVFIEQLLDLVYIMDKSEDPHARSTKSPGTVSEGSSLKEQFYSDCWFVDSLADQEKIESVLMSDVKLLPPDINKQLELVSREMTQKGETPSNTIPDLSSLEQITHNFAQDLQRQEEILGELKKTHVYPQDDPQSFENTQHTLRLVLSELSQLRVGFSYCFENEIRQWCNKNPPQLSELGPAFKRIYLLMDHFTQMLGGIQTIRTSHRTLSLHLPEKVKAISEHRSKTKLKGDQVLTMVQEFQERISILEQSLNRPDTSTASGTQNTSFMGTLPALR